MHYKFLAISDPLELTFGLAPKPVTTRSGMVIGGGKVYPELNFTLPPMSIDAGTMPEVRRNYEQIIEGALRRAADLEAPGVVIEFETRAVAVVRPAVPSGPGRLLSEVIAAAETRGSSALLDGSFAHDLEEALYNAPKRARKWTAA